jgi:ribosomal protein L35
MKMKTKKIVAKRFKVTSTGLYLRGNQNARHLRSNKSKKQIRRFKVPTRVNKTSVGVIQTFLPYA